MGSSSSQTSTQSSTSPWAAATPEVNGLLSGVSSLLPNTGVNSQEQSAIDQLTNMGNAGNPYAGGTSSAVSNLLNGGGANNYAGTVNNAYQQYQAETNPLASNTDYNPMNTPGIGTQLAALNNNITNQVNGQFASAGRSGSAANTLALATGLANGEAPVLTAQYNQNVQNQQNAANNLFGAGNTAASTLEGFNQNANTNAATGVNSVGTALTNSTWGPQTALTAQELGQSLPASNLGLLAQIGIPLAQLGTNSSGTSNTTSNPSLLSDLTQISGIAGKTAGGGSGLLGLLGLL